METAKLSDITTLLVTVDQQYRHQQEIKKLKGEHFNIFSILRMESQENATHSAFLGELLNPEGSHLFKDVFLKYFLKAIGYEGHINTATARVELEKYIGQVDLEKKTGGRIDLLISDQNGNIVTIENKLYASDQEAQMERYTNFNKGKNTVFYLTLFGDPPSKNSTGLLEEGSDFYCISYRHTIIEWLSQCLKESTEQPILRESIKQYILLIKKLTNQLSDNKMEKEILASMKKHFTAAKFIADNVWQVELEIAKKFLEELREAIHEKIGDEFEIEIDEDLTRAWTGLTITHQKWDGIYIKLEGNSKIPWHNSVYGIVANKNIWDRSDFDEALKNVEFLQSGFRSSHHWPYYQTILRFNENSEKEKLLDENSRKSMVEDVSKKMVELVELCEIPLSQISRKPTI